jgi:hypothetical protein
MAEYKLPVEMPSFLGAGSEFIPVENLSVYGNNVIKLDDLNADSTLIGYIYGGINSTSPNIFWSNDGTQSIASSHIFMVFIVKKQGVGVQHKLNRQSIGTNYQ